MKKFIAILMFLFLANEMLIAQEPQKQEPEKTEFKVSAQYRARAEYRDGYKIPLVEEQDGLPLISQRMRLIIDFKSNKIETSFNIQEARAWGQTPTIDFGKSAPINPVQVKEAWAKYNFSENFGLKLGRMDLNYGDNRLLCNKDWNNVSASHDAALLQFKKDGLTVDLALTSSATNDWAYNSMQADDYIIDNYKNMAMLFASKKFSDALTVHVMELARGYQRATKPGTFYVYNTVGPNVLFNSNGIKFDGSFYYQLGKTKTGADLKANFYTANVSYNTDAFSVGFGYDAYSGKAYDDTDEASKTFQTCEWGAHKFLGLMDMWLAIPAGGIRDINAIAAYNFSKKTSVNLTFHNFGLAQEMKIGEVIVEKPLGSEIDFTFKHVLTKGVVLVGGYSTYMVSDNFEVLKGVGAGNAKRPQWAWLMINFTPTLFASK